MIGMIAAVSVNGVIGQENKIPFDYSEDMKYFKMMTLNSVVVMGRKTFEGIGRPLPKRDNIVITRQELDVPGIKCMKSIPDVLRHYDYIGSPNIWFIGGQQIYQEGMDWADLILLTLTPDTIEGEGLVRFPFINPLQFEIESILPLDGNSFLQIARYIKRE